MEPFLNTPTVQPETFENYEFCEEVERRFKRKILGEVKSLADFTEQWQ